LVTVTRHTAVLALGFVLFALVMACGESQPTASTIEPTSTPDIKATVVARIEEKQAEDAVLAAVSILTLTTNLPWRSDGEL
jgi:hypothetical protein